MGLAIPFLILTVLLLWGIISSNLILKPPRDPLDANPMTYGRSYDTFTTLTSDGIKIEGWFVPSETKAKSTIIILHGVGANRSDVLPGTIFLSRDYNLLYMDFRNHGRSGGKVTSLTCLEIRDFESAVKYLESEKKEYSEKIGVLGFSMGGAVAISGSAKMKEIIAVVAESPFSSYNQTVFRFGRMFYGIPSALTPYTLWFARMRLGFDPEECSPIHHISSISPRPVLIIQGGSDERMPESEGLSLYLAAKDPKEIWTVSSAGHGDIRQAVPEEYEKRILRFFQRWMEN